MFLKTRIQLNIPIHKVHLNVFFKFPCIKTSKTTCVLNDIIDQIVTLLFVCLLVLACSYPLHVQYTTLSISLWEQGKYLFLSPLKMTWLKSLFSVNMSSFSFLSPFLLFHFPLYTLFLPILSCSFSGLEIHVH